MGCGVTLNSLKNRCQKGYAGVKFAWVISGDCVTPTIGGTPEKITSITLQGSSKLAKYRLKKDSSSFTSTLTPAGTNGGVYVQTVISLSLGLLDSCKRAEIDKMMRGDLALILLDNNGHYWYFGMEDYVITTGGTSQSGASREDDNGYTIELTDNSNHLPYEVVIASGTDAWLTTNEAAEGPSCDDENAISGCPS